MEAAKKAGIIINGLISGTFPIVFLPLPSVPYYFSRFFSVWLHMKLTKIQNNGKMAFFKLQFSDFNNLFRLSKNQIHFSLVIFQKCDILVSFIFSYCKNVF